MDRRKRSTPEDYGPGRTGRKGLCRVRLKVDWVGKLGTQEATLKTLVSGVDPPVGRRKTRREGQTDLIFSLESRLNFTLVGRVDRHVDEWTSGSFLSGETARRDTQNSL